MTLPTATITFLVCDIAGSTWLWEAQPDAMRRALARRDALLRDAVEAQGGTVFRIMGDAIWASFTAAPLALRAALEAQRAFLAEVWELQPFQARIALHTGTVEEGEASYLGPALNRVARLLPTAHGNQIVLSLATEELVCDHLPEGVTLHDLGAHRLQDLIRPEHIFQVVAPDLPADFPPLKTLESYPTNLPLQPTALIGREAELLAVGGLLRGDEVRLLTLTGAGGIGKTRLALQVAADLLDEFADGVYFVALAALTDPASLPTLIAQRLEVRESGKQSGVELLKASLRGKQMLLLLDNFEHLVPAAPVVADLLAACPHLKVLVTSREPLRLRGEQEFPVPLLALPGRHRPVPADKGVIASLSQYAAVELFIRRALEAKPNFAVTNENAPTIAEICMRLDGLPLAIELAAARIKLFSPRGLLERLASPASSSASPTGALRLLTGGARDLPARQQTLRATLDWSYHLLEEGEQTLFRRLAVFAGGWTVEAAEEVCQVDGDQPLDVVGSLASLLDKNLLRQAEGAGAARRFTMLETIREYAQERLEGSGEADLLRRAHTAYFLTLAEAARPELMGGQQVAWLNRLEVEHDNLSAALEWSFQRGEAEVALRLTVALGLFWYIHGHLSTGQRWTLRALGYSERAPAWLRAQVLREAGFFQLYRGEYAQAEALLEEHLRLCRELGDKHATAEALNALGNCTIFRGDYPRTRSLFEEALSIWREAEHRDFIALTVCNLGWLTFLQGDFTGARELFEESLVLAQEQGDLRGIMIVRLNLAWVALEQGDDGQARDLFLESFTLAQSVGDRRSVADCLEGLAGLAVRQEHAVWAAQLYGAAAALRHEIAAPLAPGEHPYRDRHLALARTKLNQGAWEAAWTEGQAMPWEEVIALAQQPPAMAGAARLVPPPSPTTRHPDPFGLTRREVEVLRLISQGLTDAEVAERLVISPRTVNAHLSSIYNKLGVKSRAAATRFAIDNKLV